MAAPIPAIAATTTTPMTTQTQSGVPAEELLLLVELNAID
jgi:hypothetical protein